MVCRDPCAAKRDRWAEIWWVVLGARGRTGSAGNVGWELGCGKFGIDERVLAWGATFHQCWRMLIWKR